MAPGRTGIAQTAFHWHEHSVAKGGLERAGDRNAGRMRPNSERRLLVTVALPVGFRFPLSLPARLHEIRTALGRLAVR